MLTSVFRFLGPDTEESRCYSAKNAAVKGFSGGAGGVIDAPGSLSERQLARPAHSAIGQCVLIKSMCANCLKPAKGRAASVAGLLLLCFLWSLGSVRADLFPNLSPNLLPYMQQQEVSFALLALASASIAFVRRVEWPQGRQMRASVFIGLGLFVAPAGLVYLSNEWVSASTRVALFSLAPVFAVVFEPYIGSGSMQQNRTGLVTALVAVIGTLCIFPLAFPPSIEGAIAFAAVISAAACVAAANCLAVKTAVELPPRSIIAMTAISGATATAGIAALSAVTERSNWKWAALGPELGWSAVVELPGLLLLFWLMRRMSAARMTTRYVLAPFISILIVLVLLRPTVGLRAWIGLLLVAAGTGWLLFAPEDDQRVPASHLGLDLDS